MFRRFMELVAQAADVAHDGVVALEIFFLPDGLKKLLRRYYASLVAGEIPENLKLQRRQRDLLAIEAAAVGGTVDDEAADVDLFGGFRRGGIRRSRP